MMEKLTDSTLLVYAAKHYYSPQFSDEDEFFEDLKRFKYVKRLINRYLETNEFPHRLLLNHIIIIFNVFGIQAALAILQLRLDDKHWPVIKPFLVFLKAIRPNQYMDIKSDPKVEEKLRKI